MRRAIRFRLRTLLWLMAACAVAAGGVRHWYAGLVAQGEREMRIEATLHPDVKCLWEYVGPASWGRWRLLDGTAFRRATTAHCEEAEDFAEVAAQLQGFERLHKVLVLGRQLIPRAQAEQAGQADRAIDALRTHPSLRVLVVDASIRGAPLEYDAPIYTRDDKSLLEELLPNVRVEWIEVN